MVKNYFENFLIDPDQYRRSEEFWNDLWRDVLRSASNPNDWRTPWLGTGSPLIQDGNPIFSAISLGLRRAIRIIQQEPVQPGLDFQVWLDSFGGPPTDPESISELVVACVLSDVAAYHAQSFMREWIEGNPLSFGRDGGGRLVLRKASSRSNHLRWNVGNAA
jgi:hypothetical protein